MMVHPEIQRVLAAQHVEFLRHDARRPYRAVRELQDDASRIELRLCRVGDEAALAGLAALNNRQLPKGSFVVALVDGRLAAALPVDGGPLLADPFAPTAHLRRLLEVRAAQLRPRRSRSFRALVARRATV
jgi:hypothetical protein